MFDFHIHTIYSDGTDEIDDLLVKVKDLEYFSITDHDSIEGIKHILRKNLNIPNFVRGVEFSTKDFDDSVHILYYNYEIDNPKLLELIRRSDEIRHNRLIERIKILKKDFGIKFKKEDLDSLLSLDNPTKPNIAKYLVRYGYAKSVDDAIRKYLFHKLKNTKLSSEEVIKTLKDEKGVLVFAHPLGGINEKKISQEVLNERINRFKNYGIKGLECCYSLYNDDEQKYLIEMAKLFNLYISGGSDYHGKNKRVEIGTLSSDNSKNYKEVNIMEAFK